MRTVLSAQEALGLYLLTGGVFKPARSLIVGPHGSAGSYSEVYTVMTVPVCSGFSGLSVGVPHVSIADCPPP